MSDYPADAMGALIRNTFRTMVERVEAEFEGSELVLSQWLALRYVGSGHIRCIGDVTRELGLESGSATRLVDQLELKNYLARRRDEADRRVVGIKLTDEGQAMLDAIKPRISAFWEERLSVFTHQERVSLFALLTRLRDELAGDEAAFPSRDEAHRSADPTS